MGGQSYAEFNGSGLDSVSAHMIWMIGATDGLPSAAKASKAASVELLHANGNTPAQPSSGIGLFGAAAAQTEFGNSTREPGMKKFAKRAIRFQPFSHTSGVSCRRQEGRVGIPRLGAGNGTLVRGRAHPF